MSALTVVYLNVSRNVLAAVTRATPPGAGEPVNALVGTGLPVRAVGSRPTQLEVPASLLAIATVDKTLPDVVIDPQGFHVIDDPQDKTRREVKPFPPETPSSPRVHLALTHAHGAVVTLKNVPPTTSRQAVVVLLQITQPPQTPQILAPVTVTGDAAGTTVAGGAEFNSGERWEFAVFVELMRPKAISQLVT